MNQITTRYVTENGACYEQYVITDAEAKTELVITPERGGMITGFSLNGEEYIWTRHPNFSECNRPRFGVPVLFPNCGLPDNGVHIFDGKAYPMENHGFADLCAWDVESVGPDGVTLALENVMESSPETLVQIAAGVDDPRLSLCLDVGHANTCVSTTPPLDWVAPMSPWLRHVHLHNNEGDTDLHQPLGEGSIPMEAVLDAVLREAPEATFTIENQDCLPSLVWLAEKGYIEEHT